MTPHASSGITRVGFIGSGRLAESVARNLIKKMAPQRKFCYKKQRLVSTLLASDPSQERRQVFDELGFTTTEQNQEIIADCDVVFIGTNAREALQETLGSQDPQRALSLRQQLKNKVFVSLMGDMPAEQVESLIFPGAKVIRMMPQSYLEKKGLAGILPPSSWATVRNVHASEEDVKTIAHLAGISTCIEINEEHADLWAFNTAGATVAASDETELENEPTPDHVEADFHERFIVGDYLGTGRFAEVFKATDRETGKEYAVKCIKEEELTREGTDTLMAEVAALSRLNHPNVIAHHGFYSEDDKYFLVLDYCEQGSVRRLLRNQKSVPEAMAKSIIRQLLQGLEYCHSMGLVHRDVKAENVLLTANEAGGSEAPYTVKLADFGLSKELDLVSGYLQDMCGTPQYLSPEIVSGRTYAQPADIWSAGILSYMLLSGHIPFDQAANESELFRLIRIGAIWYHYPGWQLVSPEAKDFVQRMLDVSPATRLTAAELLTHKWMQS